MKLFIQLCFIDVDCPHNNILISEIRSQAHIHNFYEAFFEAAPQLLVQFPFALSRNEEQWEVWANSYELGKKALFFSRTYFGLDTL